MTAETLAQARDSEAAEVGARAGLVARGVLWLLIGILTANIALGGQERADEQGAFAAVRDQPFGRLLLVVLALAFAAHAVFRLVEAAAGHRRWTARARSVGGAAVYGFFAVSAFRFLQGKAQDGSASRPTSDLLQLTAGRWLVLGLGLAVISAGVVMAVRGLRQDFTDRLDLPAGRMRTFVERVGSIGMAGRGAVFALVGSFLVDAAWRFDARRAKGLDQSLRALATQPCGGVLLWVAAAGIVAFAAWSFLEARYRSV